MRYQIGVVLSLLVAVVCVAATGVKDAGEAEAVLKSKGLTKVGSAWLVDGDVHLRDGLRTMRQAKRKLDECISRRIELDKQIRWADQVLDQLTAEDQNVNNQMTKAQGVPYRYNQLVAQSNTLHAKMRDAQRYQDDLKAALAKIVDPRDDYVVAVVDVSDKTEAAARQYETLASDATVTAAIASLNEKGGPKSKLGPSDAFAHELPGIRRERAGVNTAAIKFNNDDHTPQVDVTLNGKLTVSMTLDSGASFVSIGWTVAKELGITPGSGDRVIKIAIANGTTADAYVKTLDTVRLGPFTAEHVECIVAPESEKDAPSLLGGTFLQNFVYKMDLSAGEVRLSQIGGRNDLKDLRGPAVAAAPGPSAAANAPRGTSSRGSTELPPAPSAGSAAHADGKWVIVFRSVYPSLWDTPMNDGHSYAVPLDAAPATMAYLRMRNAKGDFVIIPITRDELRTKVVREKSGWEGRDYDKNGARHLGIFVKSMPRVQTGSIDVTQGGSSADCTGYGFGNRVRMDDVQGYVWAGKPMEKGVIEIAVTSEPLTASEKERLLSK